MKEKSSFSLGLLKPDCTERGLIATVLTMVTSVGLEIVAIKTTTLKHSDVMNFYINCRNEYFFEDMSLFLQSGLVTVYIVRGIDAISRLSKIVGLTDPPKADCGTIRSLGIDIRHNLAHSSNDEEEFLRQAQIIFSKSELIGLGVI